MSGGDRVLLCVFFVFDRSLKTSVCFMFFLCFSRAPDMATQEASEVTILYAAAAGYPRARPLLETV